jgi:hypothetical protein
VKEDNVNPYQAPVASPSTSPRDRDRHEVKPFNLKISIVRWLAICGISAAPSFVFGFVLEGIAQLKIIAMLSGILTFVAIYVYIESRKSIRRRMKSKPFRTAIYTGYITRIAISVLFPVGVYLDVMCGMVSVGLTDAVLGQGLMPRIQDEPSIKMSAAMTLLLFYITTLVQGVILNLILGGYTLIVYAIAKVFQKDTY